MAHLMTDGRPCAYPNDDHNGQHYSAEALAHRRNLDRERIRRKRRDDPAWRERERERQRAYNATTAGWARWRRYSLLRSRKRATAALERLHREGASIG